MQASRRRDLTLHFAASDDLGNLGEDILPPHSFQVYKGDLPPLAVPSGFTAAALPAGAIDLTWQAVPGAAACEIQARGPGETDFHDLLMSAGNATDYLTRRLPMVLCLPHRERAHRQWPDFRERMERSRHGAVRPCAAGCPCRSDA